MIARTNMGVMKSVKLIVKLLFLFFLRRTLITLNVDILQHHWLDISMGKHLTNNTTAAMAEMREAFYFFNGVQYEWGVIIRKMA